MRGKLFITLVLFTAVNNAFSSIHFFEVLSGTGLNFFKKIIHSIMPINDVRNVIEGFVINELEKHISNSNLSAICQDDIIYTLRELLAHTKFDKNILESWPLKMLDSFGKLEAGLLSGNHFWMGNFDQCVNIKVVSNSSSKVRFLGEYCLVNLKPAVQTYQKVPMNISLNIGTCFPSSCTLTDKQKLLELLTTPLKLLKIIDSINLPAELCTIKEPPTFDAITQFSLAIICLPVLLVCVATIVDYIWNYRNDATTAICTRGLSAELLLSFSAVRSLKTLFHKNEVSSSLSAMHGIRVLSMMWVIAAHTSLSLLTDYPWHNHLEVSIIFKYFLLQPFAADGLLSVTTFFTLSGFLVAYLFMQQINQQQSCSMFIGFYVYRYVRLSPAYIIMLLFFMGPAALLGEGPLWKMSIWKQRTACRQMWWSNMLYLNCWDIFSSECYPPSWYLSVDTMLYLIAPIFLYPLIIKPVVALIFLGLSSIAASIATLILIVTRGYVTFVGGNLDRILDFTIFTGHLYMKPWYHFSSYAIGMTAGYLLFICEQRKIKFTKHIVIPGWILSLLIMSVTVFGKFPYFSGEKQIGPLMNAIYGTFSRPVWAFGVSWIIFACAIGSGGPINRLLSMMIFIPMSRLTYSAYLVHLFVLIYYFGVQKHSLEFTFYNMGLLMCSMVMITMAAAFVLAILAEFPILEMIKQLAKWYYSSAPSSTALTNPFRKFNSKIQNSDKGTLMLLPQTVSLSDSSDSEFTAHS